MVSIKIILPILFFVLFIFIGGTIVNILMSPIYMILSEKTETVLTGKEFPFDSRQTVKDVSALPILRSVHRRIHRRDIGCRRDYRAT